MKWQHRVVMVMLFFGLVLSMIPSVGFSQNQAPEQKTAGTAPAVEQTAAKPDPSTEAFQKAANGQGVEGPAELDLGPGLAILLLDPPYRFFNSQESKQFLTAIGNPVSGHELGLIFPGDDTKPWFMVLKYEPVGYIRVVDGQKFDSDALLERIKDAAEAVNQKKGAQQVHVLGWEIKPEYNAKTHRLIWAVLAKDEKEELVNYQGAVLGRDGYTVATIVAPKGSVLEVKAELDDFMNKYTYQTGHRYEDYAVQKVTTAQMDVSGIILASAGIEPPKPGVGDELWFGLLDFFQQWWIALTATAVFLAIFWKDLFAKKSESESES